MKNQIVVVCYEGKNYFLIESARKVKFLVRFIRMKYFGGPKTSGPCAIEVYRGKVPVLWGFVYGHTRKRYLTARFDHSDVPPICTERDFRVLSAEPFLAGDILVSAESGGEFIANELHYDIVSALDTKPLSSVITKISKSKIRIADKFTYEKITKNNIVICGLY